MQEMYPSESKHTMIPDAQHYTRLYRRTNYGHAKYNMCPGVRYFPLYKKHLIAPIVDLGAGSGDTVKTMRGAGLYAVGLDWIDYEDIHKVDITEPLDLRNYRTATCIDVLEHIPLSKIDTLLSNIGQCENIVVSVHTGSHRYQGVELHITRLRFTEWEEMFNEHFSIVERIPLTDERAIYLGHGFLP